MEVLCVSGRGFLDEPAVAILAQLLRKHGFGVRVVPFSDLARARIDAFEAGPVRMVCVLSLAIDGEPVHLRRLIARLRRKMPGTRIAAGLWRIDEDGSEEERRRRDIAVDAYLGSLRGAIETVLAEAGHRVGAGTPARRATTEPAREPATAS